MVDAGGQPGSEPSDGTRRKRAEPSRVKLTDLFIRKVKPGSKRMMYWDHSHGTPIGFGLAVEVSGKRTFKFVYRHGGRVRWYTIGDYRNITLKDARKKARELRGQVDAGRDPQGEKVAGRSAGTLKDVAGQYVERHAKKKNKSWRQGERLMKTYVLPDLGRRSAGDIRRHDIRAIVDKHGEAGKNALANQILAACSAVFAWALDKEVAGVELNPCQGIKRWPTEARERVLNDEELPRFWQAFEQLSLIECTALRVLVLCGQRPGEVLHMRWKDIRREEDGAWWKLPGKPDGQWPGTKNRQTHQVWLTAAALEALYEVEPDENERRDGLAFTTITGRPLPGLDKAMRNICAALEAEPATPHDLRRTHGTTITGLGFTREQMNRVQNHREGGIADIYDRHQYHDEMRRIQEAVGGRMASLIDGADQPTNVVRLT